MKLSDFLSKYFQFLVVKFSIYLNRRVFVMDDLNTESPFTVADTNLFSSSWEPLAGQENKYSGTFGEIFLFKLYVVYTH